MEASNPFDGKFSVEIREARQEEIDAHDVGLRVGESGAVLIDGELVALADEYGTVTWKVHETHATPEAFEKLIEAAMEVTG